MKSIGLLKKKRQKYNERPVVESSWAVLIPARRKDQDTMSVKKKMRGGEGEVTMSVCSGEFLGSSDPGPKIKIKITMSVRLLFFVRLDKVVLPFV